MRKMRSGVLLMTASLLLISGCSGKVDASKFDTSTLVIHKNGTLTEVAVESFEADYYALEDLEKYVQEEVDGYNRENPADSQKEDALSITVDKISVDDDIARVQLSYEKPDDYTRFNLLDLEMIAADALPAQAKELTYTDTKDQTLKFDDLEKLDKYQAVIVQHTMDVVVPGKAVYVSEGAVLNDKSAVACEGTYTVIIYKP